MRESVVTRDYEIPQPDGDFAGPEIRMFFGGRVLGGEPDAIPRLFGGRLRPVVFPVQRHTDRVVWVAEAPGDRAPADAVVTDRPDLVLGIKTADCVPLLLGDPVTGVIAAVHAGWRGTANKILAKTLDLMADRAGTDPGNVRMAVGPAIGICCYEVGSDVSQALEIPYSGQSFVDLGAVNEGQARAAGIRQTHIWRAETCTKCNGDLLHSFRRDGADAGRQVSLVVRMG